VEFEAGNLRERFAYFTIASIILSMNEQTIWHALLEYARWAPSPHNIQPWSLKIESEAEAGLYYSADRLLSGTDPTGAFMYSSFGIFCEYLSIAAGAQGYVLEVKRQIESFAFGATEPKLFAQLFLKKAQNNETLFDIELLRTRRTSRIPYDGRLVEEAILAALTATAKDFNATVTFSQKPDIVSWALDLNQKTMFFDMEDPVASAEVGLWIRYTNEEAHLKRDGLWSYCLGFPGFLLKIFMQKKWIIKLPGIRSWIKNEYVKTMKGTTTIGWIHSPFSAADGWFESGRMLARLWLVMAQHGVFLHPFGSLITNPEAKAELKKKISLISDPVPSDLWLIFRLGYSENPPQSLRREVEEIIIT
jgi:hypothetical protein